MNESGLGPETTFIIKTRGKTFTAADINSALHHARALTKVFQYPIKVHELLRRHLETADDSWVKPPDREDKPIKLAIRPWPGSLTAKTNFENYVYDAVQPIIDIWKFDDPADRVACLRVMNEDQLALWAVWNIDGQIDNGGFMTVYYSSYGELAEDAVRGFRRFGMHDHADLLEEAFNFFNRPVPLVRLERWRMLETRLQPSTPRRSVSTLSSTEWHGTIAKKGSTVIDDVESRYFKLKASRRHILEELACVVDARKDKFFALSTSGL